MIIIFIRTERLRSTKQHCPFPWQFHLVLFRVFVLFPSD